MDRALAVEHLDHELLDLRPSVVQRLMAPRSGPVIFAHLAVDDQILALHIASALEFVQDRIQGARRQLIAMAPQLADEREAEDWLFSNDYTWFLSFQNICDVLDLDSSSLRERLVAWRNARGAFDPLAGPAKVYPLTVRPL